MKIGQRISIILSLLLPKLNLWWAAKTGSLGAIRKLVAEGADINAKKQSLNIEGSTPLHIASQYGQVAAIRELLQLGARINAKDNQGSTPLMDAVFDMHNDAVTVLLDLGADINLHNRSGRTALDVAASNGDLGMVTLLLGRSADPNHESKGKRATPVASLAHNGNLEVLKVLLKAGASVSKHYGCDDYCFPGPALNTAATFGRAEFVRLLLDAKADPNVRESKGWSALMSAVRSNKPEIVKMLLCAGADVNAKDDLDRTALDVAEDERNDTLVWKLIWAIKSLNPARPRRLRRIIQILVEAGAKRGTKVISKSDPR
jgi:ankyrin repeat protein